MSGRPLRHVGLEPDLVQLSILLHWLAGDHPLGSVPKQERDWERVDAPGPSPRRPVRTSTALYEQYDPGGGDAVQITPFPLSVYHRLSPAAPMSGLVLIEVGFSQLAYVTTVFSCS